MARTINKGVDVLILNKNVLQLVKKDFHDLAGDLFSRGRLRRLFEKIRDEVTIPSIDKNFEVGGRPRWEPLSPITLGMGAGQRGGQEFIEAFATGGVRSPLVKSGQMRKAATAKARFIIRDNEMHYGDWPEKRWFGPVHNLKELSRRAKIPNRPFTLLQTEDQAAIQEITIEWVEDAVNKHIRRRYV